MQCYITRRFGENVGQSSPLWHVCLRTGKMGSWNGCFCAVGNVFGVVEKYFCAVEKCFVSSNMFLLCPTSFLAQSKMLSFVLLILLLASCSSWWPPSFLPSSFFPCLHPRKCWARWNLARCQPKWGPLWASTHMGPTWAPTQVGHRWTLTRRQPMEVNPGGTSNPGEPKQALI